MLLHPGRAEAVRRAAPCRHCAIEFHSMELCRAPREPVHNRVMPKETTLAPFALCTRCGARQRDESVLGRPCVQRYGETRCYGIYQSAAATYRWEQCPGCTDLDSTAVAPCGQCAGDGWILRPRFR